MKPISCNQEMGDKERLLCPGAPQGPAWFHFPLDVSQSSKTAPQSDLPSP